MPREPAYARQSRFTQPKNEDLAALPFIAHLLSQPYRSLRVDNPNSTSIIVMIQNLTTTWFSFQPFNS